MNQTLTSPTLGNMEQTYKDVERLIYHICNIFREKHGGDPDDLIDIGIQVFMDAYQGWRENLAPFPSYLSTCLYRRLLEEKRRLMKIKTFSISQGSVRYGELEQDLLIADRADRSFNLADFMDELSSDAKTVLLLVLETPPEIASIIAGKGGHPKNIRSTIRQHLTNLNWTYTRIVESFGEISKVLQ